MKRKKPQNLVTEPIKPKPEPEIEASFKDDTDICQQLMSRYSTSTAPQHRHLLATAAAIRSILSAESLPLTPAVYFAAAIDNLSDCEKLDSTAMAALLSLVSIVVPLMPEKGIERDKVREAVGVLVGVVMGGEGLGVASVRGVVKCLGVLIVGFCDLEDWGSVKLGFETLLKFSTDKRPKVRKSAQECLEKVLKSFQSKAVVKEASKLVLPLLKTHMPVALKLSELRMIHGSKDDILLKPEHLEILHMLNLLNHTVPYLSPKVGSKILSEIHKLMSGHFSALTRHIFKCIESFYESSRDKVIVPHTENIIVSLSLYISSKEKNPMDTVITAASLLKIALDKLHANQSSSLMKNIPKVCGCITGLLTHEAGTASQAFPIMKKIIDQYMDPKLLLLDENQLYEDLSQKSDKAELIRSVCTVFNNTLSSFDGIPNEHLLGAVSALFLQLRESSFLFMENIVLKLADLMNNAILDTIDTIHLQNCIGSAVVAMGPEKMLQLVPISINADDFTCSNIWMVPILRDNVVGASLEYYMKHILPLAKSFEQASVKSSVTRQDLQAHAQGLWGLLPAFCRCPVDTHLSFKSLAELLTTFLKEDSFMHQNIAVALQVLVDQNRSVLISRNHSGKSSSDATKDSVLELRRLPSYSTKIATKNIKALASCSTKLLQALTDLFVDSLPEKRMYIKDAIGCLASITDSSVTKKIFTSVLERFGLANSEGKFEEQSNSDGELMDKEQGSDNLASRDVQRCVIMELAFAFIEGAKEDLIDVIYNCIVYIFKTTDVTGHCEAYLSLSKILEEHTSFSSSRLLELIDLLVSLKSPLDVISLRNRFACFHFLMAQTLEISSDEENTKAFLLLNEIIITLKEAKDEARKVAYDTLIMISSSLRSSSCDSSNDSYAKLITMIMGYLSGSSPQITSGAVSALSVIIYNDPDICTKMPDLVLSVLSLLENKAVEIIKAVLGFVKVLVSCLQAEDIQNCLSDIINGVLQWSSLFRFHFRSKVTIILEIIIRKCGSAAVESITPEKYKSFLKTVLQNRHHRPTSKENETETVNEDSSVKRLEKKRKESGSVPPGGKGSLPHRKRKRENNQNEGPQSLKVPRDNGGGGREEAKKARYFKNEKRSKNHTKNVNKRAFNEEPKSGGKIKMKQKNMGKKGPMTSQKTGSANKFRKHKSNGKRQKT